MLLIFHHLWFVCCYLTVVFGSWYEHVKGWWEKKQTSSNIFYLFFEDLIEVNVKVTVCGIVNMSTSLHLFPVGRILNEKSVDCARSWDCLPLQSWRNKSQKKFSLTTWSTTGWWTAARMRCWISASLISCAKVRCIDPHACMYVRNTW